VKKPKDPKAFIRIPGYPGGNTALEKFVKQNLKYPKEALEKRIEGTVQVDYDFNHKGKITKAIVSKGLGHGCDEEALRLVKLLRYKNAHVMLNHQVGVTKKLNNLQYIQKIYTFVENKKHEELIIKT